MQASHRRYKRHLVVVKAKCLQGPPKTLYLLLRGKDAARLYLLAARGGEAPQRAFVGQDLAKAEALLALLAAHAVSPCHLPSVVFDFYE